jgi:integrase
MRARTGLTTRTGGAGVLAGRSTIRDRDYLIPLQLAAEHDLIFSTMLGEPFDRWRVNYFLNQALRKAGLPHVRVRDLRHTVATLLLEEGEHPRVVQEMLGHSTVALRLGTYSHVTPTMQQQAARKMDALFGGAATHDRP